MTVHPFRMYRADESADIVRAFTETIALWNRQWFPSAAYRIEFRNVEGNKDPLAAWIHAGLEGAEELVGSCCADGIALSLQCERAAKSLLGLGVGARDAEVSPDSPSQNRRLERQLMVDCLGDLMAQISGTDRAQQTLLNVSSSAEMAQDARFIRGGGAGVLTVLYDDFEVQLLLSASLLSPQVPAIRIKKIGKLIPVMATIVDQHVALRAELGNTVLTIGDLDRLAVGDVVRLDQSIDTTPKLATHGGTEVVSGRLGSSGGHKALQVY